MFSKAASITIFWVFGMTRPRIESRSAGPLSNILLTDRPIGLVVECSPMARETGIQSPVESYQRLKKRYLIPSCLTFSVISYVSRVKCSNPRKGVAPSPKPRGSSYWKGSLRVTLDYGRQLYTYILAYKYTLPLQSDMLTQRSFIYRHLKLCKLLLAFFLAIPYKEMLTLELWLA